MTAKWKLERTRQCKSCPHRQVNADKPVPKGYRMARATIAEPGSLDAAFQVSMLVMTCHESRTAHCVGWLARQIAAGAGPALKLYLRSCRNVRSIELVGEQRNE